MKYEFVVVGAGPAGSVIASRLAKSAKTPSVLLLEAGGANAEAEARIIADRYNIFMTHPHYNYFYKTVPQKHQLGRELDFSRGRGLGGSSSINFAFYTIGPKDEYDIWAQKVGDESFNWQNARRRYNNIEDYDFVQDPTFQDFVNPKPENHGQHGPLPLEFAKELEPNFVDTIKAGCDYFGMGYNQDVNSGNPLGIGVAPSTSRNGLRSSAAVAYLSDVPSNLTIAINSPATKIIFDGDRAVGVVAGDQEFFATKEVIVCAGAIDSPKLLMLSGVGPIAELKKLSIPVNANLPVGQNLEDHPLTPLTLHLKPGTNNRDLYGDPERYAAAKAQFMKDGTGPLSILFNSGIIGFFKPDADVLESAEFKSLPKEEQDRVLSATTPAWELAALSPTLNPNADLTQSYLTIVVFLHCPQSRGSITLASANPADAPLCDANMLTHPFDRLSFISAVRKAHTLLTSEPLMSSAQSIFDAPASTSNDDIWRYLQEKAGSTYHMSCTVKMGKPDDAEACVTSDFKVKGLQGLRVADMSVAPFVPSCHTVSTAYFIGETAAERLIGEYGLEKDAAVN